VQKCTKDSPCSLSINGPGWFALAYSGTASNSYLRLTPNVSTDVYITKSAKSDPNNFIYDFAFKAVVNSTLTIGAEQLGIGGEAGYSVALYVDAVDEGKNRLLDATVNVEFQESGSTSF